MATTMKAYGPSSGYGLGWIAGAGMATGAYVLMTTTPAARPGLDRRMGGYILAGVGVLAAVKYFRG